MRIVVSGMIAADPHQGGATWAVLQYLLGFRALGHDIYFIEPVSECSLQPRGTDFVRSINARYFLDVMTRFGFDGRAALVEAKTRESAGIRYQELASIARRTDLLINISGVLTIEDLVHPIPIRVYLDVDPAFVQFWYSQGIDMRFGGHTHYVTTGQSIGRDGCVVPDCGLKWMHTFQPVVLAHWPVAASLERDALTTVGNWRSYGSIEHAGVFYGQKAHSMRPLFGLARSTDARFCLAMAIHPDESQDVVALAENGWELLNPADVSATPENYQRFIQGSLAEFGISKSGYVASRCGWFSDRSACYLASGRPVIAQETGFSNYLPTGDGLLAFDTVEAAIAAIDAVRANYKRHACAARDIAETYFDSGKVLSRLLDCVTA
jgi:hypothetical protein